MNHNDTREIENQHKAQARQINRKPRPNPRGDPDSEIEIFLEWQEEQDRIDAQEESK